MHPTKYDETSHVKNQILKTFQNNVVNSIFQSGSKTVFNRYKKHTIKNQGPIFLPTKEQLLPAGFQFFAFLGLKFTKLVVYPLILRVLNQKQREIGLDFRFL